MDYLPGMDDLSDKELTTLSELSINRYSLSKEEYWGTDSNNLWIYLLKKALEFQGFSVVCRRAADKGE